MRISSVRISGFRPIPFCASYDSDAPSITWDNPFEVVFPTEFVPEGGGALDWAAGDVTLEDASEHKSLSAIIGANSSGKSSLLYALDVFFGSKTNLEQHFYNRQNCEHPIIVEVSVVGLVNAPGELPCVGAGSKQLTLDKMQSWLGDHCEHLVVRPAPEQHLYRLTIASVWCSGSTRAIYIRNPDGSYVKAGTKDKTVYQALFPQYRLVVADNKLGTELDAEKKTLMGDLFLEVIERQKQGERSLFNRINRGLEELTPLLERASEQRGGKALRQLEDELSGGLASVNPNAQVRFDLHRKLPTAEQLFRSSHPLIDDGTEMDPGEHGLGMQRSFVLATLKAWCEMIGHKEDAVDYFFAIEEPEIYLHPHAWGCPVLVDP